MRDAHTVPAASSSLELLLAAAYSQSQGLPQMGALEDKLTRDGP